MFSTQRCGLPVFGSMNIRLFDTEFATISDALSGVAIKWCGSLPVGMVDTTWWVASSIRLSVASPEFSTITLLARAGAAREKAAAIIAAPAAPARMRRTDRELRMKARIGKQRPL